MMIQKCWIIAFVIPTLVSSMPTSLPTTRNSQGVPVVGKETTNNVIGVRNMFPEDKVQRSDLIHGQHAVSNIANRPHLEGHVISGAIGPVHLVSNPPAVSTTRAVSQPAVIDQIGQTISSADFLCYNDNTSLVIPDVPCPAESSQKTEVTSQLLNLVLKYQGGEMLVPGVSSVSPPHLHGYNLSDIGSADWMNYNQSDLSTRLQTLLQQLQENRTQLLDHLLEYTSSNSLRNITSLTNLLLGVLNSTPVFNVCENDTSLNSTNSELSCDELRARIDSLNYLNSEVQKLIASEEYSNMSAHIHTNATGMAINGSTTNTANLDSFIENLIQRLRGTKAESKALAELYLNLLRTLSDFKAVVIKLMKKFVKVLLESNFFEISEKLSRIMFDIEVALGGDVGIEQLGSLASQTRNDVTDTPADKTAGHNLNTVFETTTEALRIRETGVQEGRQYLDLFNHSLLLELIKSATNGTNITMEAVEYFEQIVEVAVTLIASLTELSRLLREGKTAELDQDAVLENLTAWHSLRSRTKRDVSGYVISTDRCQRQGNIINQTNFISLCSSCLHTTVLDNTYYPRYLTEKICSGGSSNNPAFRDGCLFQPGLLGGRPAGLCKQQEFYVLLLRQVPGKCMKVISKGQEMVTDQWQSTTHALRIGCECVVDQNSQFAKYTHFP